MRSLRIMRCRPCSLRVLLLLLLGLAFVIYCYYYTLSPAKPKPNGALVGLDAELISRGARDHRHLDDGEQCPVIRDSVADIDTTVIFPAFDFQPSWLRSKEFWDKSFEDRYESMKNDSKRPRLKVIVVPHSHNDPGWLKTFEQYFDWKTKNIINNMVSKLQQFPNMTFIWTEISFLNAWWERSHPVKQKVYPRAVCRTTGS